MQIYNDIKIYVDDCTVNGCRETGEDILITVDSPKGMQELYLNEDEADIFLAELKVAIGRNRVLKGGHYLFQPKVV